MKYNDYSRVLAPIIERTPKAVLAAIVVSLISMRGDADGNEVDLGDGGDLIVSGVIGEWNALHQAGIVPQRPPKVKS